MTVMHSRAKPLIHDRQVSRAAKFVGMICYLITVCVIGYGCGDGEKDCYGFKNSVITFSLVDDYTEETPYQTETDPWPRGALRADRVSESCGKNDIPADPIRVEEQGRRSDGISCDRHYGTLVEGERIDFILDGDRQISGLTTTLREAFGLTDFRISGRGELFENCHGWYTIMLYSGPQYYAGSTVPEDRIFDAPIPGLLPNWFVLRIFEPDEECEGLDLGDDPEITWCADTWVAKIDSIVPQ